MKNKTNNYLIDFFLIILVSVSSIIIYLSRIGLDNNIYIILKAAGLSFFIILLPNFLDKIISYDKNKFYLSKPLLYSIILSLVIISGFLNNFFIQYLSYIYFFLGFFLFFSFLFLEIFRFQKIKIIFFIFFFSIFFSIFITAVYYQNHYTHPLMIEKLINGSFPHRDTMYHAAIAGMFKTYNFIGTGIDGFIPHYYHTFSHSVFGLLSLIIGANTLDFYSILYPIIVTPIFLMFFIYAILEVSKYFSKINNFKEITEESIYLWIFIYLFFALPFNIKYLPEKFHYLQSQSYTLALILLFLIIYTFFFIVNSSKNILKNNIFLYSLLLYILVLSIFSCYSKLSFSYILTILFSYLFLRLSLYKNIYFFLLFIFWLFFLIFFYFDLVSVYDGRDIEIPESYSVEFGLSGNYSYLQEFFFSYMTILFIVLKLISLKIFSFQDFVLNIKNKKIMDIEILFLLILSLLIIPFQYFKGIQLYISYIFIISNLKLFSQLIYKK